MHSTSPANSLSRRSTQEPSGRHADPRDARSFRALLEDPALLLDGAPQALPPPLTSAPTPPAAGQATAAVPAASVRAAAVRETALPPPSAGALDAQTLEMRVSQGPLAGLRVQMSLQGARLALRMDAPPSALSERLQRGRAPLAAALSAALGVDVALEVHHEQ